MGNKEEYGFFAMLDRMQYIERWALMRNSRTENIKEHSFDVAVIAHALTLLHNDFEKDKEGAILPDPYKVQAYALLKYLKQVYITNQQKKKFLSISLLRRLIRSLLT